MNTFKKTVSGVGTCALIFGGIYAANAQDINGGADSVGSYESNLEISRKRVLAAKNYLLNHLAEMGITDVTINTEYMGDLASKTKPDSEDRRVDVTIYPKV